MQCLLFFALKNTAVPFSWVEAGQRSLCGLFSAAQINNSDNTDCKTIKPAKSGLASRLFELEIQLGISNFIWNVV